MNEKTTSRGTIIAVVLGAGVVALLIGAVLFGGGIGGTEVPLEDEVGSPQTEGTALPPMPREQTVDSSATGVDAPAVTGTDYDENTVTIENDGRPKAVVFLAHWCPHCQGEVPEVQRWLNDTGGVDGVDLYSVSTAVLAQPSNYPPSEWLEEEGWTVPLIRDDARSSVLTAYGDGAFPYWVFVNSDGTVALRVQGRIPINDLEQILEGLS
jgi:thiol-disulfide isomerase/thioredoxin